MSINTFQCLRASSTCSSCVHVHYVTRAWLSNIELFNTREAERERVREGGAGGRWDKSKWENERRSRVASWICVAEGEVNRLRWKRRRTPACGVLLLCQNMTAVRTTQTFAWFTALSLSPCLFKQLSHASTCARWKGWSATPHSYFNAGWCVYRASVLIGTDLCTNVLWNSPCTFRNMCMYLTVLFSFPFGLTGRVLEPITAGDGQRQGTLWTFGGSVSCSRVLRLCSEGILAPPPTTIFCPHRGLNRESSASQLTEPLPPL